MRHISMRRLLLVVTVAAAALVLPAPPPAAACSCAPVDVAARLADADGAFVGRLLSRYDPDPVGTLSSATLVRSRYQVERPVKGDVPSETIEVWSAWMGASCGLETPLGQRVGLLLRRLDGRWVSSLCEQADADAFEAAAPPSSAPATERPTGPPATAEGTGAYPLLAGGAGAGMVAATAAVIRRRRLPKLR